MDNLLALVVVRLFTAALMVLAAVWFYVRSVLDVVYSVVRVMEIIAKWIR